MKIPIVYALGLSLLGIAVVFVCLISLWIIIAIMARILRSAANRSAAPSEPETPEPEEPVKLPASALAKGSCGDVSLYEVPDETAAIIMAIVADETGIPLNELRFKSIREVEE